MVKVGIFGAGSIGCYMGGHLAQKLDVCLVGRDTLCQTLAAHGLTLTNHLQHRQYVDYIKAVDNSQAAGPCDIVLMTMKSQAVQQSLPDLAALLGPDTLIVCMQNGIGCDEMVRQAYPHHQVTCAIVAFNVQWFDKGHFHCGTDGNIVFEYHPHPALASVIQALNQTGIAAERRQNYTATKWGKLLLNLNNCINALSDIPLKSQLEQRNYRHILADSMEETLTLLAALNIRAEKLTTLPVKILPMFLRLPDWIFKPLAQKMLAMDPLARSSMWDDLNKHRETEIDFLNGAVVSLAQDRGIATPANQALVNLVKQAQQLRQGSPGMSAETITGQYDSVRN